MTQTPQAGEAAKLGEQIKALIAKPLNHKWVKNTDGYGDYHFCKHCGLLMSAWLEDGRGDTEPCLDATDDEIVRLTNALVAMAAPVVAPGVALTDEQVMDWWASENGLEDCNMCVLTDFAKVVRAVEGKLGIASPATESGSGA